MRPHVLVMDKHAHYLMIVKGNQSGVLHAAITALTGKGEEFADTTHLTDDVRTWAPGTLYRSHRTSNWDQLPHAAQVLRITASAAD